MIDPTPNEKAAFVHGGEMGGEYLDSTGKTDLESLDREEWLTYCDHLRELAARDEERLRRPQPEVPF